MAASSKSSPAQATLQAQSADGGPPRLFLIDGYSNIFRAFYAIRNLSSSKGEPTNAVFGFVQILRKLLKDEAPDLLGVALDVSRKTVRSERYAEYKANRAPMPEDLRPQIPWIRKVLDAYRIPILELASYEADDVLGTLAAKAEAEGYRVVLVSADKDLMQLVTDQVSMLHTGRNKLYDPALVEEDFGVPPAQVVDVLALMGDASDNVPGVKGIGEKGAKALIREYGSLEALLEQAAELKRKAYREGLKEHRDMALLSQELVTIHCDLDLAFEPEKLVLEEPDLEILGELFRELEFFSLAEEALQGAAKDDSPIQLAQEATTVESWKEKTAPLRRTAGGTPDGASEGTAQGTSGRLAVAMIGPDSAGEETAGDAGPSGPVGLAVAAGSGEDGPVFFADFRRPGLREAALETLLTWLAADALELEGHDLKEALRFAGCRAGCHAGLFDSMLVSYVLRPATKHSLEDLAFERLQRKPPSLQEAGFTKGQEPAPGSEDVLTLAGETLELTRRFLPGLRQDLKEQAALDKVYREIEEPLLPVLVGMEERGVLLDCDFLAQMSLELGKEIDALEGEIYRIAGEEFNINSSQQLGVILFEKLGYPVLRRTKKTKSYATGAEILEELASRGYPLPAELLRYRELTKLRSTYVDALPTLVAQDGRIHTRFNQAVAATGRLSSAHPNLQNIPVRTELGQRIRRAFVAPPGHFLLAADYSQVELRVLAHIAREEALQEAFLRGEDIHQATAARVFGIDPGMVSGEQRRAAKTINFGIIYGISPFGLARNLGVDQKTAKGFIDAYLERYPGVRRYVEETQLAAEETGKVETLYGRVRWLADIKSKNRALKENARRMAINARIQGTAADIMKLAMIAIDDRLRRDGHASRLLLTVHDELVLEVPEAEFDPVSALVKDEMEGVAELAVPLVVDLGSGPSWYEAK